MIQDFRFGLRMLLKNPGFTAVAVLTLALGMAATTAIFSVVYAVVLGPLPFPESERLVSIWTRGQAFGAGRAPMTAANHRDFKEQSTLFEDIALVRETANYNLTGEGIPERLQAARIDANLFPLLRVEPILGRGFTADEIGRDAVVILSHAFWQRKFAGDPDIIGKTIRLESVPHTVVGVMGPEFQYPTREFQIWTPLTINPADFRTRRGNFHLAVARLKPGVTVEQAQAEIDTISARLAQQYPDTNGDLSFTVTPLRQDIAEVARKPLFVLLGAVIGLLLIGCGNLANLLLTRALARSHETAVRAALGATRARLIRQTAMEMGPILVIGAWLGVVGAEIGIDLMVPWLPAALPRVEEIRVSAPVLLFSGLTFFATAMLTLFWPAIQSARVDLVTDLREARTASATPGRARVRDLLVVGQVALTVVLLAGAGLLIRTFAELKSVNPGFRPQGVLTLYLAIPRNKYKEDQKVASFCRRIVEEVRVLPGVESAGMVNRLPMGGIVEATSFEFEGAGGMSRLDNVAARTVTPDYLRTMGIPLIEGRPFSERDNESAPQVAIVDEQIARSFWPDESAVGKRIRSGSTWLEIVGVAGHIRHDNLDSDPGPQVYRNYNQAARDRMVLVVRTSSLSSQISASVLDAIWSVDPEQPAYAVRTMDEVLERSLAMRWFNTVMLSIFSGTSLLLAMLGIYGVVSWSVSQRTREIGIRMALGAQRSDVLGLVLRQGIRLAGSGVAVGICGAFALTRLLGSLLHGVSPTDPLTFAMIPAVMAGVALLACYMPARRAASVEPTIALRQE